jgi:hypothetical protein
MKTQKHNEGQLKELKVKIEEELVNVVYQMSENSGMSVDEIVCIALKRFRSSHADYEGVAPRTET